MKRLFIIVAFALCASAQTHPRLFLDPATLADLRDRAAQNSLEWQQLALATTSPLLIQSESCARLVQYTPGYGFPDDMPPVLDPNDPVPAGYSGVRIDIYNYYPALADLALCYQITKDDDDQTMAAKYLAQATRTLEAITRPFGTLTSSAGTRAIASIAKVAGTGQAEVTLHFHNLTAGTSVTIAGVTGCAAANTTAKVGTVLSLFTFRLNNNDGTPLICETASTNQNMNFLRDSGYDVRMYGPALAIGYDWLYDTLTADLKTRIYVTMNAWLSEYVAMGNGPIYPGNLYSPQNNYHSGFMAAAGLVGIATRGAGENPDGQTWYDYWRNMQVGRTTPFFNRWLDNSGGTPEAWQYAIFSHVNLLMPLIANYKTNADDLVTPFHFASGLMRHLIHVTTPDRLHMIDRGYVSADAGSDVHRWAMWNMVLIHYVARQMLDPFATRFKRYIDEIYPTYWGLSGYPLPKSANFAGPLWFRFLFWDSSAPSVEWRDEPLSLPMMSNPAGGYGRVVMRSGWDTSAVLAEIHISPYTSDSANAKERFDKGSLLIQRADPTHGNVHLLVNPQGEASRTYNSIGQMIFHVGGNREHRLANSIFYAYRDGFTLFQSTDGQPGANTSTLDAAMTITTYPTRIDRFEDFGSGVYLRGTDLENTYAFPDSGYNPVTKWSREVLYIRPKVFAVYDRTIKTNGGGRTYAQQMSWTFGKTPAVQSDPATGMKLVHVEDGAIFKGAMTTVEPPVTLTTTNWGASSTNYLPPVVATPLNIVYQVNAAPAVDVDAAELRWMTVLDAADSAVNVAAVAKLTASNASAAQIGTTDVVVFAHGDTPTLPISYTYSDSAETKHYICGLAANTGYTVVEDAGTVTITTGDGSGDLTSSAAGVLLFEPGVPPVVITTASLPNGQVGVAYSQSLTVEGGTPPYTWSVSAGSLPTGLSLSESTVLSGTPSVAQSASFTLRACDAESNCDTQAYSVTIAPADVAVVTATLPDGTVGSAYSQSLSASGGTPPFTWSVTSGGLCAGLTLAGGVISGTPTTAGTCPFTVRATDSAAQYDEQVLSLLVHPAPVGGITVAIKSVRPSASGVIVTYGAAALPSNLSCTVGIYSANTIDLVGSAIDGGGAATRQAAISGLAASTTYDARVVCGAEDPAVQAFATEASSLSTAGVAVTLKPPAALSAVGKLKVEYGPAFASSVTDDTADANGRYSVTISAQTVGSIVQYRWQWLTAAGVAVTGVSKIRFAVVK